MMRLSEELAKPWNGCRCLCFCFVLFFCLSVCHSVCLSVNNLQVTILEQGSWFFGNMFFMAMGKRFLFRFPKFSFLAFLGPFFTVFRVFSSLSFVLATSHPIRPINISGIERAKKYVFCFCFFTFSFLTIWGPFLTLNGSGGVDVRWALAWPHAFPLTTNARIDWSSMLLCQVAC